MRLLSSTRIGSDIAVRAIGITLVVLNHATSAGRASPLLLGLNMLVLVAGFSFGRFLPPAPTWESFTGAALSFARRLAIPCLAFLAISAIWLQTFQPLDFLFISNWFYRDAASIFPAWFPMVLIQMIIFIALVFSLPFIRDCYNTNRFVTLLMLLIGVYALRVASFRLFDFSYLDDRLPQMYLWNFVAGWFLFIASRPSQRHSMLCRCLAFAVVVFLSAVTWGVHPRFWTTLGSAAVLVFWARLVVPYGAGRVLLVLSQASLTIFLVNKAIIAAYVGYLGGKPGLLTFAIALTVSTGLWLFAASAARAFSAVRRARSSVRKPIGATVSA